MKNRISKKPTAKIVSQKQINRRNFVAFAGFIGLNALMYGGWKWLYKSTKENRGVTGGTRKPLRRALNQDELISRKLFSSDHLVKTYPKSMAAQKVRVN